MRRTTMMVGDEAIDMSSQ